jgi:flagellar L-ring protein precursor FlgH
MSLGSWSGARKGLLMRKSTATLVAFAFVLLTCDPADGGSIWAKRESNLKKMYSDDVARGIGDTLTIKITEDSKVDNKGKRDLSKQTSRSSDFNGELGITDILPKIPGFTMSADSANQLTSKADFKDERTFEDRISVVVIDVLANGSLVVSGTRDRHIAGDVQTIEVSGIVRIRRVYPARLAEPDLRRPLALVGCLTPLCLRLWRVSYHEVSPCPSWRNQARGPLRCGCARGRAEPRESCPV